MSLVKNVASVTDVNGNGIRDAGDRIGWTFTVTNTSNVTLNPVAVSDPKAGAVTCPVTTLAPGASTTCTAAPYTVTQAEGDAGVVTNTATATGRTPGGATLTSPGSSTSTTLTRQPATTLSKNATVTDVNANGRTDLGDRITWTFQVRNTGNVTLTGVQVNDPTAGAISCVPLSIAPGATSTCTATVPYTITQPDVDAGRKDNTATASGQDPAGSTVTSPPASASVPVQQTSALALTKAAAVTDVNGNGVTDLGDRIGWSFVVRNTGTVTLSSVAVADPRAGTVTCPVTTLAPGAQTTCTAAPYAITQADVDAGVVSNTATSTGTAPGGATVTSNTSTTDTPVTQVDELALVKTGTVTDVDGNGTDLGDTVSYAFQVTNSGTVTITTLAIVDPRVGPVSCPTTTLAPGAQSTCTATGAVTQADVDAGASTNTAQAQGQNPGGATVTSNGSTNSIPVPQTSSLSLTKTAAVTDVDGNGTDLGDTIRWTFTVTNSGTTTISSVAVSDPLAGSVSCAAASLAPGAS
ncbi:MAG: DUF7507 domain-containing protein, partial [Dermatophilaceae bacterium]